jgi:transcriptional repressor NrdR
MRCPKCGNLEDKVIDSRSAKSGAAIRRRRECLACLHRFTTYEEIERRDLRVIKRDGRHEPFDRQKLLSGMVKACEKRPVSYDALERAVEDIIQELEQTFDHEVPTSAIGIRVMERLHAMDDVAYIRYASVYRQFQDIGEFIHEIESLGRKIKRNALQQDLFVPWLRFEIACLCFARLEMSIQPSGAIGSAFACAAQPKKAVTALGG